VFTALFRTATSISIHHPLQGGEPSVDNHSSSRSHEAHPIQDGSSISPLMSALSTSSIFSIFYQVQQLFSYLLPASNCGNKKTKQKQRQDRIQERITKEEREKGKFNQMTKSQTEARKGHLS
jgi:hypothetical protein